MNTSTSNYQWIGRRAADAEILELTLRIGLELAREGREGRCVGTIFLVGDPDELMPHTRCLILDPLHGHDDSNKLLRDPEVRETLKELSQIDGAFVISRTGVAVAAGRYLDVSAKCVHLPKGLGSRHMAAAAITKVTDSVAIVVSGSAVVRIFDEGECQAELRP